MTLSLRIQTYVHRVMEGFHYVVERPLLTAAIVLVLVSFLVVGLSLPYYLSDPKGFWAQVLAEAHGMIFDIAVIGILLYWLNQRGEVRQRIRMYQDEIDDYRQLESAEASFRTVGNIKRLNRHQVTQINLVNSSLPRTNLNYVNLSGSNMNSANLSNSTLIEANMESARLNQANFENSNLNHVCLRGAYASGANFRDALFIKAQLQNALLIKANFNNAYLMEADLRGSFLMGADFENASLYKADLRGAKGLTAEQLSKAKTLYLAKLDKELQEQLDLLLPSVAAA
ncbi:MAG: pentapeptide repeat-containing protein [Cyclobacteriaceae bacterium]|nr:pentapeptide repeat-containing protein [Cyclobacteriaceae bacterium]